VQEISLCLGDVNPKVRRAAFRLAERLKDDALVPVLQQLARRGDAGVAKGAIRCLAQLRSPDAVGAVVSILSTAHAVELEVACCQALGKIGTPGAIEALTRVLSPKGLARFGRRWDDQVRATAALALHHISDPAAVQALERFAKDRDPRVRLLAGSAGQPGAPQAAAVLGLPAERTEDEAEPASEDDGEQV